MCREAARQGGPAARSLRKRLEDGSAVPLVERFRCSAELARLFSLVEFRWPACHSAYFLAEGSADALEDTFSASFLIGLEHSAAVEQIVQDPVAGSAALMVAVALSAALAA